MVYEDCDEEQEPPRGADDAEVALAAGRREVVRVSRESGADAQAETVAL